MSVAVTVIVATYHCPGPLRVALDSVLRQSFADFELLVVGDHCTDATEAMVSALTDDRVCWINLPANTGSQAAPNNEGLRRARGRYVAYLGQDDVWFPDHLDRLVAAMEQTAADFVHAFAVRMAPAGPHSLLTGPGPDETYLTCRILPSTWMHRRSVTDRIGGWRDHRGIARGVDEDFHRRAVLAGMRTEFSPHFTALKFSASLFSIYSHAGDPPQAAYLERIAADPAREAARILGQFEETRQDRPRPDGRSRSFGDAVRARVSRWLAAVERRAGRQIWLLEKWRVFRFQRHRRRGLARKGLAATFIARTTRGAPPPSSTSRVDARPGPRS